MVIADSCAGARVYLRLGKMYDNPFIGCTIYDDLFYLLLKNFDNINFDNVEFKFVYNERFRKDIVVAILDNLITIFFIHNSLQNIRENWDRRVQRLKKLLEDPEWKEKTLFVYCGYANKAMSNYIYIGKLNLYKKKFETDFPNYNILDCVNKKTLDRNNLFHFRDSYKSYDEVAKYIVDNYSYFIQ